MADLNDPKEVRKARVNQRELDKKHDLFYAEIMSTPRGRAWFWRILEELQIFTSPLASETPITYHNIGRQDVGRQLLANIMRICPDHFYQAMKEANNDRHAAEQRNSDAADAGGADDPNYLSDEPELPGIADA